MNFKYQLNRIARWSWRKLLALIPQKQRDKFSKNRTPKAEPKQVTPQCEMILHSSIAPRVVDVQMELVEQLRTNSRYKLEEGIFMQGIAAQVERSQAVISTTIINGDVNDPEERHLMTLYPNRGENPQNRRTEETNL